MSYQQFATVYDKLMSDMPYDSWIQFVRDCWSQHKQPRTLVELGCGTGNITIPLTQAGYHVTGIDNSENMLAVAMHKWEQLEHIGTLGNLRFLEQDMREWELETTVDCVISFCDCINYLLEEEDILATFRQTYHGLAQAGQFIFDVHTIYQLEQYAAQQPFTLIDKDIAYIWTSELELERHEIEHQLTIFASPNHGVHFEKIEEVHVQRAYDLSWLKHQLLAVGFSKVDIYGDFTFLPVTSKTERAFFVAVK